MRGLQEPGAVRGGYPCQPQSEHSVRMLECGHDWHGSCERFDLPGGHRFKQDDPGQIDPDSVAERDIKNGGENRNEAGERRHKRSGEQFEVLHLTSYRKLQAKTGGSPPVFFCRNATLTWL